VVSNPASRSASAAARANFLLVESLRVLPAKTKALMASSTYLDFKVLDAAGAKRMRAPDLLLRQ
jgi:hypothetical protein